MKFKEQNKRKSVTFSYDDGVVQDIRLIELLNRYGLKCTFNLNSALLGKPGLLIRENQRICHYKVHPEDVKYIYEDVAAFEYGSDKQNRLEENRHSGSVNHYVGGLIFRILRARMLPFWQVFLRKPIYRKHRRLCE